MLADHADPATVHVLPRAPRLATTADGAPALSLVTYLGGGAGASRIAGGILSLTTELAVPDADLGMLARHVADLRGVDPTAIRLQPADFDSGTVELVVLGERSTDPDATPAGAFDVTFAATGRPSLGGANTATYQVLLDASAAELIEHSLDAADVPVIVLYRMSLVGLRPSFEVVVEADWERVHRSLHQKANANVYYVAADADVLVSEALEDSDVRIDTTVFGTGPAAQAAAARARTQLVEWVLERLFTPLADPKAAMANAIGDVVDDTVWSLVRSAYPGIAYRLRAIDDEQVRTLSARLDETVAERREIVPQATLGGLLHRHRITSDGSPDPRWADVRASLVSAIDLDGFPRLEVGVGVEDRFALDGLREVRVHVDRETDDGAPKDPRSFAFRSATDHHDYVVNLLGEGAVDFAAPYRYRVEAVFDPTGPFGAVGTVTGGWQRGAAADLVAEPRSAYTVTEVEVATAPLFSFEAFPRVTVELRARGDGASHAASTGRVVLTAEQPLARWRFLTLGDDVTSYDYRATYHRLAAAGGDVTATWRRGTDTWLSLPDPMPRKRRLDLFVDLPWPEVRLAFVQVRYRDAVNGVEFEDHLDLGPDTPVIRRDYAIAADGPRALEYRLTLLLTSGDLVEGSWLSTEDDRLVVDSRLTRTRMIRVAAVGGTLAEHGLRGATVVLEVPEPDGDGVRERREVTLAPPDPAPPFEYLVGDPPADASFQAVFVDSNGFVTRTPWTTTAADLVVVNLRTRTATA